MSDRVSGRLRLLTFATAAPGLAAAELMLAGPDAAPARPWAIAAAFLAGAGALQWWLARRPADRPAIPPWLPWVIGLFALQPAFTWLAHGGPMELAITALLRNAASAALALSIDPRAARVVLPAGLALILASGRGIEGFAAIALPLAYSLSAALWLAGWHWETRASGAGPVGSPAAGRRSLRGLPWPAVAAPALVVAIAAAAASVSPPELGASLSGFLPSSGGTGDGSADARAGVGDGPDGVRGGANARTSGFTDSDTVLESNLPSLTDAIPGKYGEEQTLKNEEFSRAEAVNQRGVSAPDATQTTQAGRTFSVFRLPDERRERPPSQMDTDALLFITGSEPQPIRLIAYSEFDGRIWKPAPYQTVRCRLKAEGRGSAGAWMQPDRAFHPLPPGCTGPVRQQIKVAKLESSHLPLPTHYVRFRIAGVTRTDGIGWAQDGLMRLYGQRKVPATTLIEVETVVPDPAALRAIRFFEPELGNEPREGDLQLPDGLDPAVERLVREWTAGTTVGWAQIETLVARLRQECVHDPSAAVPADCRDAVGHFLLKSRRGPDYQFATAAVVMLRILGYPARVVSGFYPDRERYDPGRRHTPVMPEDVHFWAEVILPDGNWIPLEPTPGYAPSAPLPAEPEGWWPGGWDEASTAVAVAAAALLSAAVGWWFRRELADAAATAAWRLRPGRTARARVLSAFRLVERRAAWAGVPRPPDRTPARWYRRFTGGDGGGDLAALIALADRAAHDPADRPAHSADAVTDAAVRAWTLHRFRRSRPPARPIGDSLVPSAG
jgi:transglutaminase-like putative cysteine protease